MTARVAHVTIVTTRAGRRINDCAGARRNLCGAAPTDADLTLRDARRTDGAVAFPGGPAVCSTCWATFRRFRAFGAERGGAR